MHAPRRTRPTGLAAITVLLLVLNLTGCGGNGNGNAARTDTLVLAAYTVPKEAYEKEIIPAFQKHWKEKTGRDLVVQQSY